MCCNTEFTSYGILYGCIVGGIGKVDLPGSRIVLNVFHYNLDVYTQIGCNSVGDAGVAMYVDPITMILVGEMTHDSGQ